jgi:NAD+ kinase
MRNFGIIFKPDIKEIEQIFASLHDIEAKLDCRFYTLKSDVLFPSGASPFKKSEHAENKIDFILCFGGDGTMLHATKYSLLYDAPMLGIHFGRLGFLTESTFSGLRADIADLIKGRYIVENRMLLEIKAYKQKTLFMSDFALNDLTLKGADGKLINLRLSANRQKVYETRGDGIIISTPTGATAYCMSAGGPILSPVMRAIVVTPLSPHILTVRPMVFSEDEVLGLSIVSQWQVCLQVDGDSKCLLSKGDRLLVKKSKQTIKFVKFAGNSFYKVLRKKLHLGRG